MISSKKAEFFLLIITIIWGLTFPIVGSAVQHINPLDFVFLRFLLAAIIMLPFVLKNLKYTNWVTLKYGLLLGILNLGTYSFQSMGLKTIGGAESAFITSTSVILVPFFLLFFRSKKPQTLDFICSFVCLIGLYILTGAHLSALNMGQILTIFCAISNAYTIIVIQFKSEKVPKFNLLVFYQILFTAATALPFSLFTHHSLVWNPQIIFALLFCSLLATVLVFYLQIKFQQFTTASKAALIFCAEPLFATVFAWLINGEKIALETMIGGSIIIFSMMLPDLIKLIKIKKSQPAESNQAAVLE